jgi:hypothetical protein
MENGGKIAAVPAFNVFDCFMALKGAPDHRGVFLLLTFLDGVAKSSPTCVAASVQDFDIQHVCFHP